MKSLVQQMDKILLPFCKAFSKPVARWALFIVFFWFGLLKVLLMSPAADLVAALQVQTLYFFDETTFVVILGIVEMIIGLAFLFPSWTRFAILLLVLHMITTFLPLVMLPDIAWQSFLVPTIEGQYIIKNLVILALAMQVGTHIKSTC